MKPCTAFQLLLLLLLLNNAMPIRLASSQSLSTHRLRFQFGRSANFREATNWRGRNGQPCPRDTVRLPSSPPLIGLTGPSPLVQRELLLADTSDFGVADSALVLFDGAGLRAFDEDADSASLGRCANRHEIREAAFSLTEPLDWFQPGHWKRLPENGASNDVLFDALPVDRLPGRCDAVRFLPDAVYYVKVLGRREAIPIGQVEFMNQKFGSVGGRPASELDAMWRRSQFISRQFVRSSLDAQSPDSNDIPPFKIAPTNDERQCEIPLPVETSSLMARVCALDEDEGDTGTDAKRMPNCQSPIPAEEVVGACNALCGSAVVSLQASSEVKFSLMALRNAMAVFVGGSMSGGRSGSLRLSAFRTSRSKPLYQVVLMRNKSVDNERPDVEEVLHWLESKAKTMHYAIIKTLKSDDASRQSAQTSSQYANRLTISLTSVGVLLIVAAAVIAFVFARRRRWTFADLPDPRQLWQSWSQMQHRTLEESSTGGDTAVGFSASAVGGNSAISFTTASQSIAMAFTNPIYDVSQPDALSVSSPLPPVEEDREL